MYPSSVVALRRGIEEYRYLCFLTNWNIKVDTAYVDDFSDGDNSDDIDSGDIKGNDCTEIVYHKLFITQSLTIGKPPWED